MVRPSNANHVAILMGLCNGGAWVDAQLASFAAQRHRDWSLVVGDDGSSDDGPARVASFANAQPNRSIRLQPGPQRGFAQNFLTLIHSTQGMPEANLALSDHDDVWMPDRLGRGLYMLARSKGKPMLYSARTLVCDGRLRPLHTSPVWRRPFGLANALVQNVAAGNTIMMNPEMAALARWAAPAAMQSGIVAHDWWLYQLATASGATVVQDDQPTVYYRQHGANRMGRNDSLRARWSRGTQLLNGTFAGWLAANRLALLGAGAALFPGAITLLRDLPQLHASQAWHRTSALRRLGLYRQTAGGDHALWWAARLGRL